MFLLKTNNLLRLSSVSSNAFDLATTAKLSVSSASKHVEFAICDNSSMTTTTLNFQHFLIKVKFSGLIQILAIFMAKLSIISITPSVNLTFVCEECRMLLSTCEINNFRDCVRKMYQGWFVNLISVCA